MLIVFMVHLLINLNALGVSGYLAYTLSHRLSTQEEIDEKSYDIVLALIMVSAILTSFIGKYLCNLIVSFLSTQSHFILSMTYDSLRV